MQWHDGQFTTITTKFTEAHQSPFCDGTSNHRLGDRNEKQTTAFHMIFVSIPDNCTNVLFKLKIVFNMNAQSIMHNDNVINTCLCTAAFRE